MIDIETLITRLNSEAPSLGGRVEGAAALSALMKAKAMPQTTPAAWIITSGLQAGQQANSTGMHRQRLTHTISVCWVVSYAGSVAGGEAIAEIAAIQNEIVLALAGFTPVAGEGAMELTRSALTDFEDGTFFFQTDFTCQSNLRIAA